MDFGKKVGDRFFFGVWIFNGVGGGRLWGLGRGDLFELFVVVGGELVGGGDDLVVLAFLLGGIRGV